MNFVNKGPKKWTTPLWSMITGCAHKGELKDLLWMLTKNRN